jgi:hypothetical protein
MGNILEQKNPKITDANWYSIFLRKSPLIFLFRDLYWTYVQHPNPQKSKEAWEQMESHPLMRSKHFWKYFNF